MFLFAFIYCYIYFKSGFAAVFIFLELMCNGFQLFPVIKKNFKKIQNYLLNINTKKLKLCISP